MPLYMSITVCGQVGDVLLAAAFVSYAGPFNMTLRQQLVEQKWRPDLVERCIPLTDGVKPLDLLTGKCTCSTSFQSWVQGCLCSCVCLHCLWPSQLLNVPAACR